MPPLQLIAAVRRRFLVWRSRHWLRQLLTHDDHMLADLGLHREDLSWAVQLPLTVDAADALRQHAIETDRKARHRPGNNAVSPADRARSSGRRY